MAGRAAARYFSLRRQARPHAAGRTAMPQGAEVTQDRIDALDPRLPADDAAAPSECRVCGAVLSTFAMLAGTVAFSLIVVSAHFDLTPAVAFTVGLPIAVGVLVLLSLARTALRVTRGEAGAGRSLRSS